MSSSSSAMIVTMTAGNRKNEATAMAPMAAMSTSHCSTPTQKPSPAQSRTQAISHSPAQSRANHEARSEEHTSELQSLMRISYAVFCLKTKNKQQQKQNTQI